MKNPWYLTFTILLSILFTATLFCDDIPKPWTGILDFEARNVSGVEADAVGEIFTSELVPHSRFDIVEWKNVESLLK